MRDGDFTAVIDGKEVVRVAQKLRGAIAGESILTVMHAFALILTNGESNGQFEHGSREHLRKLGIEVMVGNDDPAGSN